IPKVYRVWSDAPLTAEDVQKFLAGIQHDGECLTAAAVRLAPDDRNCAEVTLLEGKNRQIRRMYAAAGKKVERLCRIRIGPLKLDALRSGQWRPLAQAEVAELKKAAGAERAGQA
ncbi:MAG TPA: pseudouridine synthase, partial [Kiritimatiellia bacterium]|nr:pseudouridine synthase [Kiritimatiellia bacterium]